MWGEGLATPSPITHKSQRAVTNSVSGRPCLLREFQFPNKIIDEGQAVMAIKGSLNDMSLPSLVQMICTEQRKAALIVRHRRTEEGVLFFEDGEIVHARVGNLEGEDAACHLLRWTDGTFRLSDQTRIPHHTINAPWRYLMLEAMKKADEEGLAVGSVASPIILSPQQKKGDDELEYQIIHLLSQLEFSRAKVDEWKIRKRPFIVLELLAKMVNILVTFTEDTLKQQERSLEQTIIITADHHPSIRLLQVRNNHLQPSVIITLYRNWSAGKKDRRDMFTEIAQGIMEIMESYFIYITSSFHSAETADQWRDTCLQFLEELTTALQKVKF